MVKGSRIADCWGRVCEAFLPKYVTNPLCKKFIYPVSALNAIELQGRRIRNLTKK